MRLKLANTLGNRGENLQYDERLLNAVAESAGRRKDDRAAVLKRPGTRSRYTLASGQGGSLGQGLFVMNAPNPNTGEPSGIVLIGIRGDSLTTPVT